VTPTNANAESATYYAYHAPTVQGNAISSVVALAMICARPAMPPLKNASDAPTATQSAMNSARRTGVPTVARSVRLTASPTNAPTVTRHARYSATNSVPAVRSV